MPRNWSAPSPDLPSTRPRSVDTTRPSPVPPPVPRPAAGQAGRAGGGAPGAAGRPSVEGAAVGGAAVGAGRGRVAEGTVGGGGGAQATQRPGTGGPGLRLTLNPGAGAVAGVEFGFRFVRVLLGDLAHHIIGSGERELPDGHASAESLAVARRLIDETLDAAGLSHDALIGAGVSLPGPVRHHPDPVKPSPILPA